MKQQKYEQAAELFNKIIEQHPKDPLGYINFGNLLLHINDLDRAMSFFNKAIEIDHQVPAGYYGLGNLFYEQENYRSEEHTSELQSRGHLVCRLLLE